MSKPRACPFHPNGAHNYRPLGDQGPVERVYCTQCGDVQVLRPAVPDVPVASGQGGCQG